MNKVRTARAVPLKILTQVRSGESLAPVFYQVVQAKSYHSKAEAQGTPVMGRPTKALHRQPSSPRLPRLRPHGVPGSRDWLSSQMCRSRREMSRW